MDVGSLQLHGENLLSSLALPVARNTRHGEERIACKWLRGLAAVCGNVIV